MEENKKKKRMPDSAIIASIVLTLVVGGAGILWSILSNGSTKYSSSSSTTRISYLDCESTKAKNSFFNSDKASSFSHKIKLIFRGDKIERTAYTFRANFSDTKIAETELSRLNGDFNITMGEIGVHHDKLAPAFSNLDGEIVINLYIENESLNGATGKFVFLGENEIEELNNSNMMERARKIYERKGFTCEISY